MSKPILITRQTLANDAAQRWQAQYKRTYVLSDGTSASSILDALVALGPTPTPAAVDKVIGNNSWTAVPKCDGCGNEHPEFVIRVGQELDHESSTADLCGACLREAGALL